MTAVQALIGQDMSLNKSLKYCGMFKRQWYWKPKARKPKANAGIVEAIRTIREERQFYGARRIAAEASRRLGMPVNRKLVQRVYKRLGWGTPAEPKEPKSRWKPIIAVRPNQVWETDITYVWCGAVDGRCYCFNVLDIFTRQWLSYRFDTLATNDVAIESIVEAVSAAKPECANLTLQCDNRSQYTSRNFRKAVSLGYPPQVHLEPYPAAERSHRVVPQHPQAGVRLAARLCQLSRGRGRHCRGVPGLQPRPAPLCTQVCPAKGVPDIMGGDA